MAIAFILALLVDSACAAACIPAELQAPREHCSSGHHGAESPERGCDLHGHLKPVVRDLGFVASMTTGTDVMFESPASTGSVDVPLETFESRYVLHVPPLLLRNSVLRI